MGDEKRPKEERPPREPELAPFDPDPELFIELEGGLPKDEPAKK